MNTFAPRGLTGGSSALWAMTCLAASVQVHTILPIGNIGVRLSLADMLLPAVFLAGLWHRRDAPNSPGAWRLEWMLLWAASAWLIVALAHGRIEIGHWQTWAVVNRGLGWGGVLLFFTVGWWSAVWHPEGLEKGLVRVFLLFFWLSCAVSAILMVALSRGWFGLAPVPEATANSFEQTLGLVTGGSRFQGLVINPNAFGFLATTALLLHLPYIETKRLFTPGVHTAGLGLSVFGLTWSC
jgi:hypothetical protein